MKRAIEEILDNFNFKEMSFLGRVHTNDMRYKEPIELRKDAQELLEKAVKEKIEILFSGHFCVINTGDSLELHSNFLTSRIHKEDFFKKECKRCDRSKSQLDDIFESFTIIFGGRQL